MKKRTERSRWVALKSFHISDSTSQGWAVRRYDELHAIVVAFEKVGRIVRLTADNGALVLKGRR